MVVVGEQEQDVRYRMRLIYINGNRHVTRCPTAWQSGTPKLGVSISAISMNQDRTP